VQRAGIHLDPATALGNRQCGQQENAPGTVSDGERIDDAQADGACDAYR
jgi:hypothetical protein